GCWQSCCTRPGPRIPMSAPQHSSMFHAHETVDSRATRAALELRLSAWVTRMIRSRLSLGTAHRGPRDQDERREHGSRRFESHRSIVARHRAKDQELARRLRMEAPSPLPHATCTPNWWRRLLSSSDRSRGFVFSPRILALSTLLTLALVGAAVAGGLLG